jgi:hypothetical protein
MLGGVGGAPEQSGPLSRFAWFWLFVVLVLSFAVLVLVIARRIVLAQ